MNNRLILQIPLTAFKSGVSNSARNSGSEISATFFVPRWNSPRARSSVCPLLGHFCPSQTFTTERHAIDAFSDKLIQWAKDYVPA